MAVANVNVNSIICTRVNCNYAITFMIMISAAINTAVLA